MKHSEWMQPTDDEVRELQYSQLEEAKGGNSGNNTSIPINTGIGIVAIFALIFGLWYRTSSRYTSESL